VEVYYLMKNKQSLNKWIISSTFILLFSSIILLTYSRFNKYFFIKDINEALVDAIGKGDMPKIKILIENGADVNAHVNGYTILTKSFRYPYPNKRLFSRKPILKLTPLEKEEKIYEILEMLVENGANVNSLDKSGDAPIHCALSKPFYDYNEITRMLIEKGADVNIKNSYGNTPLHLCRNLEIAELLIKNGADVNAKGERGNTPLHDAAEYNKLEVAELLIKNGADINAKNRFSFRPLKLAELNDNEEMVNILKKHGAIK